MSDYLKNCNETYRSLIRESSFRTLYLDDNDCKKLISLINKNI